MGSWIRFVATIQISEMANPPPLDQMIEEINPPPMPGETNNRAATVLVWLIVAFVSGAIFIALLGAKNAPVWAGVGVLFLAAGCCLCSAFGMLGGVKDQIARIVLGLFLAGVLFAVNVVVVVFVGCSKMNF